MAELERIGWEWVPAILPRRLWLRHPLFAFELWLAGVLARRAKRA